MGWGGGILNVDARFVFLGGRYDDPTFAPYGGPWRLEDEGPDIIDIGQNPPGPVRNASPRRGTPPSDSRAERLRDRVTVPLSVDTYKSGVARKALELGAPSSTIRARSPSTPNWRARSRNPTAASS